MKLGVLVTSDKHMAHVIGMVGAASKLGYDVSVFCMDAGTKLLQQTSFKKLCELPGVDLSLCRHSAEECGVDVSHLPKDIVCGSQFNNAMMNHESDRVVVL